jgi:asparagine synthase (glutamine-hydrolysing)
MCGIVGVYARDGATLDVERVVEMRDAIVHRGPDDAGLWRRAARPDVVLGHRRLSIVDLSDAGRQPMANEDGSVVVTFGGEIYNHVELRERLERRGHRFRSRCDTEVLVHLYEELGPAMVDELVGMFHFAIWDESAERLFLARDRLGIKPLYWIDDGRTFAFASEIKALLPLVGRRDVDPTALAQYLTFVAVPAPRTLFVGVSKLPPASTLIVDRDGPGQPRRFWDPLEHRVDFDGAAADWEAELRFRLERSIERRMMSDVPVGVLLSGGVDSSTNVALMSRLTEEPVNTFSVGFRDAPEINEFGWARQIAERFGTRHHEVEIDAQDMWDFLPQLVHHQDEPIADPVCVPLHYVSKLAKDSGVTVVHVGEGADELFAGYPTYVTAHGFETGHWRRLRALPAPLRRIVAAGGSAALGGRPRLEIHREALRRAGQADGRLWWGGAVAFYEDALRRVTTPALHRAVDGERPRDVVARIAADADRFGARDELDRLIYQDLRLRLPELLLMRVDKLTMGNAVEARVPFLDHELVELAMGMPRSEKIRDGEGKHVLKRAVSDLLPPEVVWRPKQGFSTPVERWFRGELADRLERQLRGSPIAELGYLDPAGTETVLEQHRTGRADRSFQLWNLLNLSIWFDHWIAREPAAAAQATPA